MRTKYPDGVGGTRTIRKGKLIAQGAHASMAFITRRLSFMSSNKNVAQGRFSKQEQKWMEEGFTKVVVYVETEEELLELLNKAKEQKVEAHLIKDAGHTEFSEPTFTALGIGPDYSSTIDSITGDLPLL